MKKYKINLLGPHGCGNFINLFLFFSKYKLKTMHIFFKSKGKNFIIFNLLTVLIFSILYFLNNTYLQKKNENENRNIQDFIYFFWFSLITQTTVGYMGLSNNGKSISFDDTSKIFKFLNILQLLSIFFISSYFYS